MLYLTNYSFRHRDIPYPAKWKEIMNFRKEPRVHFKKTHLWRVIILALQSIKLICHIKHHVHDVDRIQFMPAPKATAVAKHAVATC
jgi:hypothetical protein